MQKEQDIPETSQQKCDTVLGFYSKCSLKPEMAELGRGGGGGNYNKPIGWYVSFGHGSYPGSKQCSLTWEFKERICSFRFSKHATCLLAGSS
jgi:hypothetical protein